MTSEQNDTSKKKKWSAKKIVILSVVSYIICIAVLVWIFSLNIGDTLETSKTKLLKNALKKHSFEEKYGAITEVVELNENVIQYSDEESIINSNYVVHTKKGIDKDVYVEFKNTNNNTIWIIYIEIDGEVILKK